MQNMTAFVTNVHLTAREAASSIAASMAIATIALRRGLTEHATTQEANGYQNPSNTRGRRVMSMQVNVF